MNFADWEKTVPKEISGDSLWRLKVYQLALFAADIAWHDAGKLMKDRRTLDLANQLYRSVGSIAANIAEGYSRGSGRDRARFYEYALGSAREARGWYYNGRAVLTETVTTHRICLSTEIIRLLLTIVPAERATVFQEERPTYSIPESASESSSNTDLADLLANVPLL